jgi:hypothetical protein
LFVKGEISNLAAAPFYIYRNRCAHLFVFTRNGIDGIERAVKQKGPFQEADHANTDSEEHVARLPKRGSKAAAISTLADLEGSTSRGYWYIWKLQWFSKALLLRNRWGGVQPAITSAEKEGDYCPGGLAEPSQRIYQVRLVCYREDGNASIAGSRAVWGRGHKRQKSCCNEMNNLSHKPE